MVASFGERLKQEREKRGMSLEEVAGATKISVRHLRALEQEKFNLMPGGIFNRGFVRSYAKHLGLDDEQVVADYREAAGESGPAPDATQAPATAPKDATVPVQPQREGTTAAQVPWVALAGLLVLGAVLWAVWSFHAHGRSAENGAVEPAVESQPSGQDVAPADGQNVAPRYAPEDTKNAGSSHAKPATVLPGRPFDPALSPLAAVAKAGFDLSLRARDEVWVSTAVDGKPPSEAILQAGQSITVHASDRTILRVGNVAAVDLTFNGHKVSLNGTEGEVRTLTFTSSGLLGPAPRPN